MAISITDKDPSLTLNATNKQNSGECVILVHVVFPAKALAEDLTELRELAASAGATVVAEITGHRRVPDAKYFVGSGKAEEIRDAVAATGVKLVIFNHVLSPAQQRNLEKLLNCRLVDRTGLILDIFAQRALSFEGKLQVELAQLKYASTTLVKGSRHLEGQQGGIGMRGPGETQLELDRRLIRDKIKLIETRLEKLRQQREQGRRSRRRAVVPTIALVGYTNAGKSTLFNRLTGSEVYAANQLFATLDPTLRRVELPQIGPVIFADTVGFIRHLPPDLIKAFHATLQEVAEADLLLHVMDVNDEHRSEHQHEVETILTTIEADAVPRLCVENKVDLHPLLTPRLDRDEQGRPVRVAISAVTGVGLDLLCTAIAEALGSNMVERELCLLHNQGKLRAELYARKGVVTETVDDEGRSCLRLRLPRVELDKLFR